MTASEKVLLLVSFRKSGKFSKDDKREFLAEKKPSEIWNRAEHHMVLVQLTVHHIQNSEFRN